MDLGKKTRLNRLFSHPSGRLCSVAVDHFCGYQKGLPKGLTDLPKTIATLVAAKPDAITIQRGAALQAWPPHAGKIPLIVQAMIITPDDNLLENLAQPEDVLRMGGDAIAVAIGVRGPNEGRALKTLADVVSAALPWGLPVIAHIYPRDFSGEPRIVHDPENIQWAVRCGIECGADVIKVPYTGDVASYREIGAACPVPMVAAGGPKAEGLPEALHMMEEIVASGARGAVIGRNVWGMADPAAALKALKSVIHDGRSAEDVLREGSVLV